MVSDTVQNGYKHRAIIYGFDLKRRRKLHMYENKLQEFYDKLFEKQNKIEDYIETIPQSNIRQIFRKKFINVRFVRFLYVIISTSKIVERQKIRN